MANRKETISAFNKKWSPVDIPNLKETIKMMDILLDKSKKHVDSLHSAEEIQKSINEQYQAKLKLQALGINADQKEKAQLEALLKGLEELKKSQEEYQDKMKEVTKTNKQLIDEVNNLYTNGPKVTKSNFGQVIASQWQMRDSRDIIANIRHELTVAGKAKGLSDEEIQKGINEKVIQTLGPDAAKYAKAAEKIQFAADVFSKAISKITDLLKQGYHNQVNAFNDTYQNIAVRNDISRGQYYGAQLGARNTLFAEGLGNNISVSQVQRMWGKLTETGLSWDTAQNNAIETILTQSIVPYLKNLDEASTQQLESFQPGFLKEIRGIGQATMALEGSNVVANNHLDHMVESLSPMARLAKNSLGTQFAKSTGMYENLRKQGMSDYDIGQIMGSVESAYSNPMAALKGGNMDQRMAILNAASTGKDMADIGQFTSAYFEEMPVLQNMLGGLGNSNMTSLLVGAFKTGLSTTTLTSLARNNYDFNEAIQAANEIAGSIEEYAEATTKNFKGDKYQTAITLQEVLLENMSTEVAIIGQQLGHIADIVGYILSAVIANVGSNALNSVTNLLGGGKGRRFTWWRS